MCYMEACIYMYLMQYTLSDHLTSTYCNLRGCGSQLTLQLIAMAEHESGYVVNYMYTTDTQLIDRVPQVV